MNTLTINIPDILKTKVQEKAKSRQLKKYIKKFPNLKSDLF